MFSEHTQPTDFVASVCLSPGTTRLCITPQLSCKHEMPLDDGHNRMRYPACQTLVRPALALALTVGASSCSPITFDCGGPTIRQSFAVATMRDVGDTLSVDGYTSVYEERDRDGTYIHQLVIGIQATDAAHYDTIPSALRPHVTGARLELPSGVVLYHVSMSDNSSQHYGPPVLAAIPINDADQSLFNDIRLHLLSQDLSMAIETDSPAVQFPRTRLVLKDSYDWRKTSGCQ